jgi:DNA invertase Pin-like site-specific DNA recombinase
MYACLIVFIRVYNIMFEEVPPNCRYAYARVSSKSQEENSSLEAQKQEFLRLGVLVKNIRVEVGSAADTIQDRPVFYHLINHELKENDLLLVTKIDRCSRNTLEFLKLQEKLFKKKVTFLSLDLPYSSDMAVNKLIATNLAAIATFENERRRERQRQGIKAAKASGKYLGRKTVINKKLIDEVKYLKETKNLSITQIAKLTGRGRTTIYKVLKEKLNYVPYNRLVRASEVGTNESK